MEIKRTNSESLDHTLSVLYRNITNRQRDVFDRFQRLYGERDGGELAARAILASCFGVNSPNFYKGRCTEDIQNALQCLQEAGGTSPQDRDIYDPAAAYIRREWLSSKEMGEWL